VFTQVREVSHQQCPWKDILHWANVCFSAHAISQPCRHTISETFRKGYVYIPGAQPALHFRGGGGAIIIKFNLMASSCLFNHGKLFRKWSQIKFSSQHFRKWELFCFNCDADRTIRAK